MEAALDVGASSLSLPALEAARALAAAGGRVCCAFMTPPQRLEATAAAIDMAGMALLFTTASSRGAAAFFAARASALAAALATALASRSRARDICSFRVGRPFLTVGGTWQGMPKRLHRRQGYSRLHSTLLERHAGRGRRAHKGRNNQPL